MKDQQINFVLIPTGKSVMSKDLVLLDGKLAVYLLDMKDEFPGKAQYIYIISDREIKRDEWLLDGYNGQIREASRDIITTNSLLTKIEATNDPKLIEDGVPAVENLVEFGIWYNEKENYEKAERWAKNGAFHDKPNPNRFIAKPNLYCEMEQVVVHSASGGVYPTERVKPALNSKGELTLMFK